MTPVFVPMTSHDQKCNITSHFSHLNLRNEVVPLTVLSASHDAYASTNGFTLPKSLVPYFNHFDLRNAVVPLMMLSASHDTDTGSNSVT